MICEVDGVDNPLFVLNPKSGNGYDREVAGKIIAAWPGARGISLSDLIRCPETAAGYKLIIAGGGDGTITTVANMAKNYDTAVLSAALGSTSCIPKSLGLSRRAEPASEYICRLNQEVKNGKMEVREFEPGIISAGKNTEYLCFAGVGIIAPRMLHLIEEAREKKMRWFYARLAYATVGFIKAFSDKHQLTAAFDLDGRKTETGIMDIERLRAGFTYAAGIPIPRTIAAADKDLLFTVLSPEKGGKTIQMAHVICDSVLIASGLGPLTGGIGLMKIDPDSEVKVKGNIGNNDVHIDSELLKGWTGQEIKLNQDGKNGRAKYRLLARVKNNFKPGEFINPS